MNVSIQHTINNITFNQHPTAAHYITCAFIHGERIKLIAGAHSLLLLHNVTNYKPFQSFVPAQMLFGAFISESRLNR